MGHNTMHSMESMGEHMAGQAAQSAVHAGEGYAQQHAGEWAQKGFDMANKHMFGQLMDLHHKHGHHGHHGHHGMAAQAPAAASLEDLHTFHLHVHLPGMSLM